MARRIEVEIVGDASSLKKALGQAEGATGRFGGGIAKMAKTSAKLGALAFAGLGAGAAVAGKRMISLASDAAEVDSKLNVVFGRHLPGVSKELDRFAKATGASRFELREQVADMGALLGPMLGSKKAAGDMSGEFVKLATDLSSFNNVSTEEALTAIRAGLVGESEPLRRFGVLINDAAVKTEAYRLGLAKTGSELTEQQKVQARASLIMQQTSQAQGDATRTAGSMANQMRALQNNIRDAATELGMKLVPIALEVVRTFNAHWPEIERIAGAVFGAIGGGIGTLAGNVQTHWTTIKTVTLEVIRGIQTIWNSILRPTLQAIGDAIRKLAETAETNWPRIQVAAQRVANWYRDNLRPTIETSLKNLRGAWEKYGDDTNSLVGKQMKELQRIVEVPLAQMRTLINTGLALIRGDFQKAWDEIKKIPGQALQGIANILRALWNTFNNLTKDLGRAIVEGLVSGIKSGAVAVKDALVGVITDAKDAALDFIGARSPSRLTAALIGLPMSEGIAKGILAGKIKITEAMVEAAGTAVDRARTILQGRISKLQAWLSRAFDVKQAGQMTPTEKLINAKEAERESARLKDAVTEAQNALNAAIASGDPEAVKAAQAQLDEARYQVWLAGAQKQAEAERKDLENRQFLERQKFEERLTALQAYLESGHATAEGARKRIAKLEKDFGLTGANMGRQLGAGFVRGLRGIEKSVAAAAAALREAAAREGVILKGRKITIEIEEKEEKKKEGRGAPREGAEIPPTGGSLVAIGNSLQGMGFQVGEHPAFGGVQGRHVAGSYHYQGRAIDVNWPGGGPVELSKLRGIFPGLQRRPHAELMIEDVGSGNQHLHYAMARGGFGTVRKPTTFLAGEAGAEDFAFAPHSRGGLGGDSYVFNFPNYVGSKQELVSFIQNAGQEFKRRNGRGIV